MELSVHRIDYLTKNIAKTFYNYARNIDKFCDSYKKLMSGLTEDQRTFLYEIFTRLYNIYYQNIYTASIYSAEEIEEQKQIQNKYNNELIVLNNIIQYKHYFLPTDKKTDIEMSVFFYQLGLELLKNPAYIKDRDFLDIGAYIGDSAIVLNDYHPRKIHAFEPVPTLYNTMIKTIMINKLEKKITAVQIPLTNTVEEIEIAFQGSGSTSLYKLEQSKKLNLTTSTVDLYVEENDLDVGLIKIDIEGGDFDALKGAANTIKRCRPVLLLSIYHHAEHFFEMKSFIEELDENYQFSFKKLNPFSLIFETMMICEPNFLD